MPTLKYLQLLRMLTKSVELRSALREDFLAHLNQSIGELSSQPQLLVEVLALHLRYIEISPKLITD